VLFFFSLIFDESLQFLEIWSSFLIINQSDIPERSSQVSQMQRIYQTAKSVIIWLGPDSHEQFAIDLIRIISDFLCKKVGISVPDLGSIGDVYQEIVFKNRESSLLLPDTLEFSTGAMWRVLVWWYSHNHFTPVWAIQEVNENKSRIVYCGYTTIEWDRVALVHYYGHYLLQKLWLHKGNESPSWIPSWDVPMLFRNAFRFGKALPWKPAGETKPISSIEKTMNVLSLTGFVVDSIKYAESYTESVFFNVTLKFEEGRK